jgi:hypothetical protein
VFRAGTTHLQDDYSLKRGRQLGERLVAQLGQYPDACWLFCAPNKGLEVLVKGVQEAIGPQPLIGCTTDGELSSAGFSTGSAVIGGIVSDQVAFEIASVRDIGGNSGKQGRTLGARFSDSVRYLQLFSDGITGDGSALLRGLQSALTAEMPIAGGTSGDGGKFVQSWQFLGDQILSDAAVAIGFCGDFTLGTGVESGWSPIGLPKKVTRAEGNILYELNGESALEVYERFLGRHARNLPAVGVEYPLGLIAPDQGSDDDAMLLRATMSVDREAGAIRFAGEIPEGTMVYLTCGDRGSILDATEKAASHAVAELGAATAPAVVFFYSCMARKMLLGLRTREEFERLRSQLTPEVPILGFYSYGEFCRPKRGLPSVLHNETATISVIGV